MDQIERLSHFILYRIFLLQSLSPVLHAQPALGAMHVVPSANGVDYRCRINLNLGSQVRRRGECDHMECPGTYCVGGVSELWSSRDE